VKIDDHQNDTSLNWAGANSTFSILENFQKEFRMIRIRQTGKNSSGVNHVMANWIEF
jgi:hypothetical protein